MKRALNMIAGGGHRVHALKRWSGGIPYTRCGWPSATTIRLTAWRGSMGIGTGKVSARLTYMAVTCGSCDRDSGPHGEASRAATGCGCERCCRFRGERHVNEFPR